MAKLADFPIEVLREILNGSSAAIDLWKTGSLAMRIKLAHRGVTVVDLEDKSLGSHSRWPQCLQEFQLESLRVSLPQGQLGDPSALRDHLKKLHSGLRSLELRALDLHEVFYTELWNFEIWPQLERFDLSDDRTPTASRSVTPYFALLPRTLTSLASTLPLTSSKIPLDDLSALPPRLQSLHLKLGVLRSHQVASLPRGLTRLRVSHMDWEGVDVSNWPSTLTHFNSDHSFHFGSHCFRLLPRSLKTLKIGFMGSSETEDGSPARAGAPNYQRLCDDLSALLDFGKASLQLEELAWIQEKARLESGGAVAYAQKIEEGFLFGLPLGLTKLNFYTLDYFLHTHMILPPNLNSVVLTARYCPLDDPLFVDGFSPLTTSLHAVMSLSLPRSTDNETLSKAPITSLSLNFRGDGRSIQHLPTTLRCLELSKIKVVHPEELLLLPPRLESFTFRGTFSSNEWVAKLPRTLTSLTVSAHILGSDIAHLPPTLTSLTCSFKDTSLAQLRQLPRGLELVVESSND